MNLKKILNPDYIEFFSFENCKMSHRMFRLFLDDMADISIYEDVNGYVPMNTLKYLMDERGYSGNYYSHIKEVVKDMSKMDILQVFTLLYFCCSKNNFNFNEMFCEECANNGTIYELLMKLKELSGN